MWQITKTEIVTKFTNSKWDKTQKFKNSTCDKTKNSKCDKTQNPNFLPISQTKRARKLKNSKCDKTQNLTTQKLKIWLNKKNLNITNLKNSNCDKTQKLKK